MPIKRFHRGDRVKYNGSIERFRGTWWTVKEVTVHRSSVVYALHAPGIGRLTNVRAQHVTNDGGDA